MIKVSPKCEAQERLSNDLPVPEHLHPESRLPSTGLLKGQCVGLFRGPWASLSNSSGVTGVNRREVAGTARSQEHKGGRAEDDRGEVAEEDEIFKGHSASRQEEQSPAS